LYPRNGQVSCLLIVDWRGKIDQHTEQPFYIHSIKNKYIDVNKTDVLLKKQGTITHDASLKLASEPEDGIAPVRKFMDTLLHVLENQHFI
jgi:hypothetical protein